MPTTIYKAGGDVTGSKENTEKVFSILIENPSPVIISAPRTALFETNTLEKALKGEISSKEAYDRAYETFLDLSNSLDANTTSLEKEIIKPTLTKTKEIIDNHPKAPEYKATTHTDFAISSPEFILPYIWHSALKNKNIEAVNMVKFLPILYTDNNFGNANILEEPSRKRVAEIFSGLEGKIMIYPGFFGHTINGELTTIGRGGSDTIATTLAQLLKNIGYPIEQVIFLKRTRGVLSSDPDLIEDPQTIQHLSYREAREVGKIIHDKATPPLEKEEIPLHVAYIKDPNIFTLVNNNKPTKGLKAIKVEGNCTFVSFDGIPNKPGELEKALTLFRQHGLNLVGIGISSISSNFVVFDPNNEDLVNMFQKGGYRILEIRPCTYIGLIGQQTQKDIQTITPLIKDSCYTAPIAFNQSCGISCFVNPDHSKELAKELHEKLILKKN